MGLSARELRVQRGATNANLIPVDGIVTLGRDPACDVIFDDVEISRRHARISSSDGETTIEDLASSNGTFVNGERLLVRTALAPGDVIELGSAILQYAPPDRQATLVRRREIPQVTTVRQVYEQPSRVLAVVRDTRKWWTLGLVCTASFMLLVDTTIVSVALPSIREDLGASFSQLQWVVDAYSAALATFLLAFGSVSDLIGRRRVFLAGLLTFTAASALCGLAWSPVALNVLRAVQGVGAAMIFGTSEALVAQEFAGSERAIGFAVLGAIIGLAIAAGPLIGGIVTDTLGWRAIFYVNVPIGLVAAALTMRHMVNLRGPDTKIDYAGTVLSSAAVFLLIFALIRGNDEGWGSPLIVGSLLGAAALFVAFVLVELRLEHPLWDLSLLRIPTFNGTSTASFTLSASLLSLVLYLTLWFQSILGASPLGAGLRLLALTGPVLLFAPVGGRLGGIVPARIMIGVGLACVSAGTLWMSTIDASSKWTVLAPGLALAGAGLGLSAPALADTAVSIVPAWRIGMASGLNAAVREFGLATGIAALGAVFQHVVLTHTSAALAGSPYARLSGAAGRAIASGGTQGLLHGVPARARVPLQHAANVSFTAGLHTIFLISAGIALVGSLAGFALVRSKDLIAG
jgi:EmrB/QacA subfamily drug resistance transporter